MCFPVRSTTKTLRVACSYRNFGGCSQELHVECARRNFHGLRIRGRIARTFVSQLRTRGMPSWTAPPGLLRTLAKNSLRVTGKRFYGSQDVESRGWLTCTTWPCWKSKPQAYPWRRRCQRRQPFDSIKKLIINQKRILRFIILQEKFIVMWKILHYCTVWRNFQLKHDNWVYCCMTSLLGAKEFSDLSRHHPGHY